MYKTKIQIASDLHLEFPQNKYEIYDRLKPTADILVIAGDMCPFHHLSNLGSYLESVEAQDFIQWAKPRWKKIIRLTGNHEYWGCRFMQDSYKCRSENFITLSQGVVKFGDVTFICATGWGTFTKKDEPIICKRFIDMDKSKDNTLTYDIYKKMGQKHREFIMRNVRNAKGKVVIVTHHMPSHTLIDDEFKQYVDSNFYFAMDYDNFMTKYQDKIDCWIYGHSHRFRDEVLNGVRTIRNPFAYPRERHFYGDNVYRDNFTIEV
jgi:predicted phosphodiesterase